MNDWSELEHMNYNDQPDDEAPTTGRIGRAVAWALHQFGLISAAEDARKARESAEAALKIAQKIDQQQAQQFDIEFQSMSAQYNTLKKKLGKE